MLDRPFSDEEWERVLSTPQTGPPDWAPGHDQPDGEYTATSADELLDREAETGVAQGDPPRDNGVENSTRDVAAIGDDAEEPTSYTVAELAAFEGADEAYIVGDGILTLGGKLLIHGASGVGKTTLEHDLMGALATGRAWLGQYAVDTPHRVLCIQGELSLPELASHAQQLVSAGYDVPDFRFARMTGLRLPDGERDLRELIAQTGARIVALDPWYRLFTGESSNQPEQVDRVFQVADRLLEDGTVDAIVVVHHSNVTGQRTAGSWIFEGWPSTILQVETVAGIPDQRLVTVQKMRAPSSSLNGARLRLRLGEQGYRLTDPSGPIESDGLSLAVLLVAEAGGQLVRSALIERLKNRAQCKDRAAAKYLGQAIQAGRLRAVKDGRQALYQSVDDDL